MSDHIDQPLDMWGRPPEETQKLVQLAVREALIMHKRLNNPIATWKDGKVVIVPPDEIEIPPDSFADPNEAKPNAR